MKYKIVLFFILFPVFALAQTTRTRDSLARVVLNDLKDSWTLGIEGNSDVVDIRVFNKFKSLFDTVATIDDDFNVSFLYDPKKKSGVYKIKMDDKKMFDVFAHDVALQVKNLLVDSVATLDSNTTDQKNMTFIIRRTVEFQKARQNVLPENYAEDVVSGRTIEFEKTKNSADVVASLKGKIAESQDALYKFTSTSTLRITMAFIVDTVVRITNIKTISNELVCTNDDDVDAVLNQEDSLNQSGDFTASGKPDYDLDGVADEVDKCKFAFGDAGNKGCPASYFLTKQKFEGFIGLQFNSAKINLPELNELGYRDAAGNDAMDVLQSKRGTLSNPGWLTGVYAGTSFTYYFGEKRKQIGISIGFTYSGLTAEYRLIEPIVYTFKASDGLNSYRRQITIDSLKESIAYSIFNLPIMFNYRWHVGRSVINLQLGPSLMIFSNTASYNAAANFGGIYQIDTITQNKITYYDHFDQGSQYNIFLTSKNINAQSPTPGANNVFDQLAAKNYDFADNINYTGSQKLKRLAVALNVAVDLHYKVSEGLTIKAGPHFVYAPLFKRKEKYKPIDRTTDEYQSVYNSNAASSYSAFGISVGFVYNF